MAKRKKTRKTIETLEHETIGVFSHPQSPIPNPQSPIPNPQSPTFPPGALVKARDREWVVLPESSDDVLLVCPIGGLDDEIVGICQTIEPVTSASFSLPKWENPATSIHAACCAMQPDSRLARQQDRFGVLARSLLPQGHTNSYRYSWRCGSIRW